MEKLIPVTVYCDSTDLYTEEEVMQENLCELYFPEEIVRAWYEADITAHEEDQKAELGPNTVCSFETWLRDVYTADGTDGLYQFAVDHGFQPERYYSTIDKTETEICPNCDLEITLKWDITHQGFKAVCPECGEVLMLCDACHHRTGDWRDDCDWTEEHGCKFDRY